MLEVSGFEVQLRCFAFSDLSEERRAKHCTPPQHVMGPWHFPMRRGRLSQCPMRPEAKCEQSVATAKAAKAEDNANAKGSRTERSRIKGARARAGVGIAVTLLMTAWSAWDRAKLSQLEPQSKPLKRRLPLRAPCVRGVRGQCSHAVR